MHWSPPEGTTFLIMVSPVPGKLSLLLSAAYLYIYSLDSIVAMSNNERVTFTKYGNFSSNFVIYFDGGFRFFVTYLWLM